MARLTWQEFAYYRLHSRYRTNLALQRLSRKTISIETEKVVDHIEYLAVQERAFKERRERLAVKLLEDEMLSVVGIARAIGVNRQTLYDWQKKWQGKPLPPEADTDYSHFKDDLEDQAHDEEHMSRDRPVRARDDSEPPARLFPD